jgi:hypothetical protein
MNIGLQITIYNINSGLHVQMKLNITKKFEKTIKRKDSN